LEGINERANAEGAVNFINEAALDPYVFTRESFLQYRRNLIKDGKTDASSYDAELEASMEDVTKASVESGKVIQPAADNTANTGASNPTAFDSMLLSFEEASLKMDQLAK
jgi:phospholipid-binding lipoprotein MlaA